jgi:hypothetical protein
MKIQTFLAYGIVAFFSIIVTRAAQDNNRATAHSAPHFDFDAIANMSSQELQNTLADIATDQEMMDAEIARKLADTNPRQVRIAAAFIAGQYRLGSSAEILARMSDFPGNMHPGISTGQGYPLDMYPVSRATIRLGESMISPLLENIAYSDKATLRDFSINFIQDYQRSQSLGPTIQGVIDEQTKAGNTEGVARLKAAAPQLLNPPPN